MDSVSSASRFDASNPVPSGAADPSLAPYRSWALQNNLVSVFDTGTTWREAPEGLGPIDGDPLRERRGQAELLKKLEPDPELALRTKTLLLLLGAALAIDTINQLTPIGIKMSTFSFAVTVGTMLAAFAVTAIVFPRLSPRTFSAVGQGMLFYAFALIAFQCSETGGADSPYAVWWLFAAFHSAYFLERRRALANVVAITVIAVLPLAFDGSIGGADTVVYLALLVTVIWMLAITIVTGRELTRRAERAVRYLALADSLTGVANLRAFEGIVDAAAHSGRRQFALIVADVDGLKGANAAFGYDVGDDMLNRLAALMRHACDEASQVARIRGDEFAVFIPGGDAAATTAWIERFERATREHNEWIKNRLPQISVSIGVACFPGDGLRASELLGVADRKMFERKLAVVRPPHEVEVSAPAGAHHLQRQVAAAFGPRPNAIARLALHSAARWLVAGLAFGAYALAPGESLQNRDVLLAIAGLSIVLAFGGLVASRGVWERAYFIVSELSTLAIIAPVIWCTGGWQSPFQLATFFPLAFYAQFMSGRSGVVRAVAVILLYCVAFWTSIAVGASPAPVGSAAQTLFATIVTAQALIALILQSNRRSTVAAIRTIRDAATHDPLTGVGNIHAFRGDLEEKLTAAAFSPADVPRGAPSPVAGRRPLPALMVVDVDDFRSINNYGGHVAGDAVLKSIADRLSAAAGDDGAVYRIDCDEFAVLLDVGSTAAANERVARATDALRFDAAFDPGVTRPVGVSYGHAVWRDGVTPERLVDEAEAGMAAMRASHSAGAERGGAMLL